MKAKSMDHIHREVSANLSSLIEETISHWRIANSMLPPQFPLVLFSDSTLEAAEALIGTLKSLREAATVLAVESDLVAGGLREKQRSLREWLHSYNRGVRGSVPGTKWERLLERLPHEKGAPFLTWKTAFGAAMYWGYLEEEPPMGWPGPLLRMDGAGLAEFRAEVRAFSDAMEAAREARIAAEIAEEFVGWTREQLAEICLRYPAAVKSRFRTGHRLLDSVPKPWPQEKKAARSAGDLKP